MEGLHCEILTPKDLSVLEKDEVWGRFDLAYGTFFFFGIHFSEKKIIIMWEIGMYVLLEKF